MLAHMNAEALAATVATGEAHFWSRSRGKLWKKGETSGHILRVVDIRIDCDQDAVWLIVDAAGPACHTGEHSCFYRRVEGGRLERVESRRVVAVALLLVAGCSAHSDAPAGNNTGAVAPTGLEAAAIAAGVIPDPNSSDITGLYAHDTDRVVHRPQRHCLPGRRFRRLW